MLGLQTQMGSRNFYSYYSRTARGGCQVGCLVVGSQFVPPSLFLPFLRSASTSPFFRRAHPSPPLLQSPFFFFPLPVTSLLSLSSPQTSSSPAPGIRTSTSTILELPLPSSLLTNSPLGSTRWIPKGTVWWWLWPRGTCTCTT